ncbi:sigma 54-interacting transcriptional regulator [Thermodesulfobacteriota bacterium]
MIENVNQQKESFLGLKKLYVLYEISSALNVSIDTTKNFFSIMNIIHSRLETTMGSFITLDKSSGKKRDELLFGFDEDDIKNQRYRINDDIIRNVSYTKDIVYLIRGESGIEVKGAQMASFISKELVSYILVPVLDKSGEVVGILVVDKLFDLAESLDKDIFFLKSIATAISQNLSLKLKIEAEKRSLINENDRLKRELSSNYKIGNIKSVSENMGQVLEMVKQISGSTAPVLFTGEAGTGKELTVKALHYNSPRVGNAFLKIHCGALPEKLLDAEIFGGEIDVQGSGQFVQKRGKLEAADGGTLYIEQIESMPLSVQGRLLEYLTAGEFEKSGVDELVKANTRIIAGTSSNLEQLTENGHFLAELYYELNVLHIELPRLRERKEDIPILAKHFMKKYAKESGKKITDITDDALEKLMNHTWPGNIRELENCIRRMIIMANSKVLDESLLPSSIKDIIENTSMRYKGGVESVINGILKEKLEKIVSLFSMRSNKRKSVLYKRISDNIDKILIELSLKKCNNVQTDAAAFLGINRNTLRTKIEKLKIDTVNVKESIKTKGKKNLDLPF